MVIQQNEPIRVWGTSSSEGEYVNVVFDGSIGSSVVKDGKWEVILAPRTYSSEPKVLEIIGGGDDSDYETFENILVGDVWWVMGQSNAEFSCSSDPLWKNFETSLTGNENISIFDLKEDTFKEKSHTRWRRLNKYSAYDASALACYTAKNISGMISNEVPQGMVIMAYSGHELSAFLPPELAEKHTAIGEKSNIYNDVVDYVKNIPVKGIIWYQGEADASIYHDYTKKFTEYIEWLREEKSQANRDFPVYCIELSPCFDNPNDPSWQYIDFGNVRGEMGSLSAVVNNFNVCVTSDYWSDKSYQNNLHPGNKAAIAIRLSFMILAKEYGFGNPDYYFGPVLKKAELSDDKREAIFSFNYCAEGLSAEKFDGFLVVDKDWNAIEDVQFEIISPDKLKIVSPREICIVKYHTNTQSTFGEHIFLKNSYGVPAAAFSYTFSEPEVKADNLPDTIYHSELFAVAVLVATAAIISLLILKRNRIKD